MLNNNNYMKKQNEDLKDNSYLPVLNGVVSDEQVIYFQKIYDIIKKANQILKNGEPDNISADPTSSFSAKTYYPQAALNALNEAGLLGYYSFEMLEEKLLNEFQVQVKVKLKILGLDFTPVVISTGDIIRTKKDIALGKPGDISTAYKKAFVDGWKKCFAHFGFMDRVYLGELGGNPESEYSESHENEPQVNETYVSKPQTYVKTQPSVPQATSEDAVVDYNKASSKQIAMIWAISTQLGKPKESIPHNLRKHDAKILIEQLLIEQRDFPAKAQEAIEFQKKISDNPVKIDDDNSFDYSQVPF